MAKITHEVKVRAELLTTITLTEAEVRALNGIFGYNVEAFLKVFYEKMGKAYVQPFEEGVRSLHASMGAKTRPAMERMDKIRKAIRDA